MTFVHGRQSETAKSHTARKATKKNFAAIIFTCSYTTGIIRFTLL